VTQPDSQKTAADSQDSASQTLETTGIPAAESAPQNETPSEPTSDSQPAGSQPDSGHDHEVTPAPDANQASQESGYDDTSPVSPTNNDEETSADSSAA
jgi:hypothetical protein